MIQTFTRLLYKVPSRVFLAGLALLAMLPFLNERVLRMAGDEKVYLSQSIEMARGGRWFVQTLAGEPSYFKGPLHYVLVRIGMLIFGNQLIAGTWMNAALAVLSGLAMYALARRRWNDKSGMLLAIATALNVGAFSHVLVSQMEVEVYFFYAAATAMLGLGSRKADRAPEISYDYAFWIFAGMAGWSKSPVHSVLIGCGGALFWILTKQFFVRVRSAHFWMSGIVGALVGVAGYLPAAIGDYDNFYATFILREQFQKAHNNRNWDYVTVPLLHFALPWTFAVLAGLVHFLRNLRRRSDSEFCDLEMVKLGAGMSLPTLLFWATWTYKGQNYNLPAMPALLLLGWACYAGNVPRFVFKLAGILGIAVFGISISLVSHFWPLPQWWGLGWIVAGFFGTAIFSLIFLVAEDVRILAVGAAAFIFAFGAFITPLGEREMLDARKFIKEHPGLTYHYYDLDPSIWSEWSVLQLALHRPIYGLHKPEQLAEATRAGHVIFLQNNDALKVVMDYWVLNVGKTSSARPPVVTPWARWLTKGKDAEGQSKWRMAWLSNDLKQLEREFFIVQFP